MNGNLSLQSNILTKPQFYSPLSLSFLGSSGQCRETVRVDGFATNVTGGCSGFRLVLETPTPIFLPLRTVVNSGRFIFENGLGLSLSQIFREGGNLRNERGPVSTTPPDFPESSTLVGFQSRSSIGAYLDQEGYFAIMASFLLGGEWDVAGSGRMTQVMGASLALNWCPGSADQTRFCLEPQLGLLNYVALGNDSHDAILGTLGLRLHWQLNRTRAALSARDALDRPSDSAVIEGARRILETAYPSTPAPRNAVPSTPPATLPAP